MRTGISAGWLPLLAVILFSGCLSSSPRYRTMEESDDTATSDDSYRFAAKVKAEETKEDDKKVDLTTIESRIDGDSSGSGDVTPSILHRDKVLLDVISFLGTPYSYGGTSKSGIDCSGFTSLVYGNALNKQLPRSTRDQFKIGLDVDKPELQFGDLVFFNTTGRTPSHVGIYIEDDLFAHASVSYGVTISSLESSYYKKRFVGARRVVE